jgi:glycosyltransferase involved in cell wall biosynthesis
MRIAHVAPFYTPIIGGVEEVVKRITEYTASRGYETYVVTYNRLRNSRFNTLPEEENINGVHVIRVKPSFTWSYGTYSVELPQVIKSLRLDVIHVHVWRHPHVIQMARLRRESRFKTILHGHAPFHRLNQLGLITWAYHRLFDMFGRSYLRSYDRYIALTQHEAEKVRRLELSDKAIIIPNGVKEDKCIINENAKRDYEVLYLGRISRSKNLNLLLKAVTYVAENVKEAELILAGPDEGLAKSIVNYARKRNVRVRYLGQVSEEEKHRLYMEGTVYALPSLYEPFGITLLEAGIHGTPAVITGEGGQLYTAPPNKTSLWAKPNPKDYAEAITTLLTDKKLREKLSQGAREWAQQFTWNKILPKYEELYRELANQ